jgi:hypothetical protein
MTLDGQTIDRRLTVLLAEYERIQNDIRHHKTTLQMIVNFLILMTGLQLAALPYVANSLTRFPELLLAATLPFAALAVYHSAYTSRVHDSANYFDTNVRVKINSIVGNNTLGAYDWKPISNIWQIRYASAAGTRTYIALAVLKLVPQLSLVVAYVAVRHSNMPWWGWIPLSIAVALTVVSVVGQHD